MGTVLAVKKGKEICIAADSLTISGGSRKQDCQNLLNCDKIITYENSYIGVADHPAWPQILEDYFHNRKGASLCSREAIFSTWLELHRDLKEKYFINACDEREDPFESSGFSSLIVNPNGIFKTYDLRSVEEFLQYAAVGSGEEYALGALYVLYDKLESAIDIAKAALQAVIGVDNDSDQPIIAHRIEVL